MSLGLKSKTIDTSTGLSTSRAWYIPRKPGEIEPYPWLHPTAVDYLEGILSPDMSVLEHGAGGSTLWFAERVARVVTVEHDPEWREKVREIAPANVIVFEDLPQGDHHHYFYDLFFIDGKLDERRICLEQAHLHLKTGGWLVLDNANHPEYAKERHALHERFRLGPRFDNNIHISKYFITEFWQLCE